MHLPSLLTEPEYSGLDANDTIPSNIDPSTISYVGQFLSAHLTFFVSKPRTAAGSPDSGESTSLRSLDPLGVSGDQEWITIDTVLIRLDTNFTEFGRFPVHLNKTAPSGSATWSVVGYDAAVCVRRYEPWIVETYNTSVASPSTLRIVGKGDGSTPLSPVGSVQGAPIANTRYLNTTGKNMVFYTAHHEAIQQMQKDNSWGEYYMPTSTVGPVVPPPTTFLLTSTYSTGNCFK